ncbi:uncharacterized protein SAPINGB_P006083 [Magnusiomyces paraingens]|uniref:GRIP domain-containing protein n=1 Tax=Magnusiomyces paraingens TaxID=2606893 RepID=A0A5E8C4C4_9ASCO|nr:uncharacterized protein SAPINGB_P006083 [Saprochaete ingens]VVT58192.1 unnamed protein product [Saprochaete ingens]
MEKEEPEIKPIINGGSKENDTEDTNGQQSSFTTEESLTETENNNSTQTHESNNAHNEQLQKELDLAISELSLVKDQLKAQEVSIISPSSFSSSSSDDSALRARIEELTKKLTTQQEQHAEELEKVTKARDDYHSQYQSLLDKVGRIKTSLGDKLKRDADDLEQSKAQVVQLEREKKELDNSIENLKRELITSTKEADGLSRDLSHTRRDYQEAITSWEAEKDALVKETRQLKQQLEVAQTMTQDLQSSIQDERLMHNNFQSKVQDLEDQILQQTNYAERFRTECEAARNKIKNLENEFGLYKTNREAKLTTMENEILSLKENQLELTTQRDNALMHNKELSQAAESVPKLEQQVKEKQLLIGKLRHEAVTLNEHLTKALRVIKENSQGDTVDRQLVTNMLLSFVTLPRADTKRFEILQLIANYLSWDDDQKSQAGLVRAPLGSTPGTPLGLSNGNSAPSSQGQVTSPRAGSFSRTPSLDSSGTSGGGFISMFADFLERESSRRS